MSNFCETCRFHRTFELSLVDRLIRDFGAVEGDLKSELTRMAAEEQQIADAEASRYRLLLRESEVEWHVKPEMSNYCGLDEARNVYYVATLRNRRGECADHTPAAAPRTCATCRHRVAGDGPAQDAREIATRIQLGVNAAALGQSGGVAPLCEKHSNATGCVPCAVQNAYDACPDWSAAASAPSASPMDGWALLQPGGQRGKK